MENIRKCSLAFYLVMADNYYNKELEIMTFKIIAMIKDTELFPLFLTVLSEDRKK